MSFASIRRVDPAQWIAPLTMPFIRRAVHRRLAGLRGGRIHWHEGGRVQVLGDAVGDGLSARVTVHDPRLHHRLAWNGSLGAGEAYVEAAELVVQRLLRHLADEEDLIIPIMLQRG